MEPMPITSRVKSSPALRLCIDAGLLGAALIFSYVEFLLPVNLVVPLPGFKPGLANIAVMFAFFCVSPRDAAAISLARIVISAVLFGSAGSFIFSLSGGAAAFLTLLLSGRTLLSRNISFIGVSALAACAHNFGQICAASLMFGTAGIFGYLPPLLAGGIFFGVLCGIIMNIIVKRLEKV